jgi:hypothetical protein
MMCVRIAGLIGLLCAMLAFGQVARVSSAPDVTKSPIQADLRIDVDLVA